MKFAAVAFLFIVGVRVWGEFENPNANLPDWGTTLVIAAVLALLLAFVLPRLLLLLPNSIVILSKKGVNNNIVVADGVRNRFWLWHEISFCSIAIETLGERRFETFSLYDLDGRVMATFGLPSKPKIEELAQMLRLYDKPLQAEDAEPPE